MIFTSPVFLFGFLPLTLALYFLTPKSGKNLILLTMSLGFYAWGELSYVLVMIASIGLNYIFGRLIHNSKQAKTTLLIGVGLNLAMLFHFKYLGFIVENFNQILPANSALALPPPGIHLPLGISFFTFQAISYLVDVYRKEAKVQTNLFHLALYISLFPQLIAGPIVRFSDVTEQIKSRVHSMSEFSSGVQRFVFGLSKKMWLANPMGELSDMIFQLSSSERTLPLAWVGITAYALQIYFDFSGYSDMAIGLGRMFGFRFLENFNYPYISKSIREFWRRWHISLSTWFRDYLYIPLGGNRVSPTRVYINLFFVFIVTGFWHGASWNFLIWGLFHGIFLASEHAGAANFLNRLPKLAQHIYTLLVVLVAWVFFRANTLNEALVYLGDMFNLNKLASNPFQNSSILSKEFILIGFVALLLAFPTYSFIQTKLKTACDKIPLLHLSKPFFVTGLLVFTILKVASSTYNPFIYFRF